MTDHQVQGAGNQASSGASWPVPRAAYVHIPFCRHRCGYCNFSVVAGREDLAEAFLSALEAELRRLERPRPVETLFIGGGTPTHLAPEWLERLLATVTRWLVLDGGGEFSVEANPADIEPERLAVLQRGGVNRLSLGVQSFDAAKLRSLERDHSPAQAIAAVERAAEAIPNTSLDLIFAAPGETLADWQRDLDRAVGLPVRHVSTYCLTYEKGAAFWGRLQRGELIPAGEEAELAMYETAIAALTRAGFEHYEVSNFARPGDRCRHNLAYWEGRGWYAFGPAAARFVDGRREVNHRSPTTYIRRLRSGRDATAERESLTVRQVARERVAFGLRMIEGVDVGAVERETGVAIAAELDSEFAALEQLGLLERRENRIRLTRRGLLVSDAVLSRIL